MKVRFVELYMIKKINLGELIVKSKKGWESNKLLIPIIIISSVVVTGMIFFSYYIRENQQSPPLSPLAFGNQQNINKTEESYLITNKPEEEEYLPKEVIGFLPSWAMAKKIRVEVEHLTQIIYFGLGVNQQGDLIRYNQEGQPVFEWSYFNSDDFTDLRKESSNSGTKMLVALKNFDNESIDNLISNRIATGNMTKQILNLIEEYNLDGINIDFEYVTDTDFPTVKFFNRFLEDLSRALKNKDPSLIISVDLNAIAVMEDPAYDMVKIGEVVDQVILMAYDYRRAESTRAGPVAPLSGGENEHSIEKSVQSLAGRVPFDKVILAIPFYGYEWQTLNRDHKGYTVANSGALATYGRVQDLIKNKDDVSIRWDDKAQSPWLIYNQSGAIKQIYYEDNRSLAEKIEFVNNQKLGGLGIWALGYEGDYQEPWQVIERYTRIE